MEINTSLRKCFDEGDASGSKVVESSLEKKISQGNVTAQEHVPAGAPVHNGN